MLILPRHLHKATQWSGGCTTELFIYPEGADYKRLDFLFRVSTATIEVEKSVFTNLPEVRRKIMILDGEIELIHDGMNAKKLSRFDTDSFLGDTPTQSIGMATDFNVMTKGGVNGNICHAELDIGEIKALSVDTTTQKLLFYVYSGTVQIKNETISSGDVVYFKTIAGLEHITVAAKSDSIIIIVELSGF